MKEIWKPVTGYDGYEISNLGNLHCWNCQSGSGTVLSEPRTLRATRFSGKNYYRFIIYKSGKPKSFRVHRLVAQAFLEPQPTPKHIVMHLDDDCANNQASNLKWGTHKDNMKDMTSKDRQAKGEDVGNSSITEDQARQIKKRLKEDTAYGRMRRIAKELNVSYGAVTAIAYGKTWRYI